MGRRKGARESAARRKGAREAAEDQEKMAQETAEELDRAEEPVAEPEAAEEAATEEVVPLEQHQRLLAEFDNYRKRIERQQARFQQRAAGDLYRRLLPLIDDFERAKSALLEHSDEIDREGLLIILGRLAETLEREGLEEIAAAPGTTFDPEVHEAVLTIPSAEVPEGSVAEVLETGYRLGETMLRPARVAVARSAEQRSPGEDEDTG
jgi:molecular chaperone GrpE